MPMSERMASFAYTVIDATGAELTGEISAPDLPAALEQLRLRDLLATERVKPNSLLIFSRQFTTAIEAGLNGAEAAASPTQTRIVGPAAAWSVYAGLALAVGSFLLAVLLMATGVVATPHT
jgi:hypothetical protein